MPSPTRRIALALLLVAVAIAGAAAVALAAALQDEPSVPVRTGIDPGEIARAAALLRRNDPRRAPPGRPQVATVGAADLETLLDFGARRWVEASTRIELRDGQAVVTASGRLPPTAAWGLAGRWVNVRATFAETGALPELVGVRVGRLPVPTAIARRVAAKAIDDAGLAAEWRLATDVVDRVRFEPGTARVVLTWRDDTATRLMQSLLPSDRRDRLRAYTERLAALTRRTAPGAEMPLASLVGPLFALASERTARGGDPVAENRAAIVVLTLYATGRDLAGVLPEARGWPRPQPAKLLLGGREDFPIHYLVSAALVVEGTGALSQALGLAKELADSRGGSGFSFNDIAANRAGERFGELAVGEPLRVQRALAGGVADAQLMPPWSDLPEFLSEREFVSRYGGVGAPPYRSLIAEIDRRIEALPLLKP